MSLFRDIADYLFPPVVCGTNARMAKLLAADPLPPPRVRVAEPMTAVERLQADVDRAVAAAEREMEDEWMDRR